MKVRFNKNESISILGLTKDQYFAIRNIVMAANNAFDEPEDNGDYYSNEDFICVLTRNEIEALDKIKWLL